jgi:hypothetical protein
MAEHGDLRVVAATFNSVYDASDASHTASQLYEGAGPWSVRPLGTALMVRAPGGHLHSPRQISSTGDSDVVDLVVNSIVLNPLDSAPIFDPRELRAMADRLAPEAAMLVVVIRREEEEVLQWVLRRREGTIAATSLSVQMLEHALGRRIRLEGSASNAGGDALPAPPAPAPDMPAPPVPAPAMPPLEGSASNPRPYMRPPGGGPDVPPDDNLLRRTWRHLRRGRHQG